MKVIERAGTILQRDRNLNLKFLNESRTYKIIGFSSTTKKLKTIKNYLCTKLCQIEFMSNYQNVDIGNGIRILLKYHRFFFLSSLF